jgi:hypothetical protein
MELSRRAPLATEWESYLIRDTKGGEAHRHQAKPPL